MIAQADIQLALQQRLVTLSVCTTGSTTLSASATGYARASGSFVDDNFAAGMELVASGFGNASNNGSKVIGAVTALAITCAGTVAESAGVGRTLSVGLPTDRGWENIRLDPTTRPYIEEELAGETPGAQVTVGPLGDVQDEPLYVVRVHVLQNTGSLAANRYIDALRLLFPPRLSIDVGGLPLRVKHNPKPFRSSLIPLENAFAFVAFTIPLWVRSPNTI